MAKDLLQTQRCGEKSLLDPRTKMLLVVTIATIIISGGGGKSVQWQFWMNVVRFVLTAVPLLLFLAEKKWGSAVKYTTTVSEFMAAMERMHLPQKLSIPLSVIFRFFPTIGEEYGTIGDAMRMRGIRFGGGKLSKMLEYRIVPLIVSCVKIGDDLSAAALTRGLGAPIRRTNICRIGFGVWDVLAMAVCAAGMILFLLARIAG